MITIEKVHPSWHSFFTDEIEQELSKIYQQLGTDYTPREPEVILRFLQVDLQKTQIVWLGQDVYPAKDVATGRSFEVGNLHSWTEPFRQVS